RRIFPLSRVRVGPCRALAGDAQQHADRSQRAGQRCASVTEERQRHAGHRERVGDGGHAEQRREVGPGGDRGGARDAERVRRANRYGSMIVSAMNASSNPASISTTWRMRPPPAQYALTKMPTITTEVPRSFCSISSTRTPPSIAT